MKHRTPHVVFLCLLALVGARADSVVVFNEVMYHPVTSEMTSEWIELYNQMSVDVDVSGWRLTNGINYTFPNTTLIKGGGYLVVAISPSTLLALTGVSNVIGPFSGRLSNSGETIELRDINNRLMDSVSYGTDEDWPVGPDGAGVSLAKRSPNLASGAAGNWTASAQVGGTPGAANFPVEPAPPKLVFNEVAAASSAGFWLELINTSDALFDLAGVEIVRTGGSGRTFALPNQSLAPGELVSFSRAQLGFGASSGDKLFLFGAGHGNLLDAVVVKGTARGRYPDGLGPWLSPTQPTPGASNIVMLHDEIVINEIMYHHRPMDAVPATASNTTLITLTANWRYNDSGADLGTAWRAPSYDDEAWPAGPALFHVAAGTLSGPKNTALTSGRSTYYFRTSFPFSGETNGVSLTLRSIVDDGAVFYLNGAEIYRANMPAGAVLYSTPASSSIGDAGFSAPVSIALTNLIIGNNVLAAEVHQYAPAATSTGVALSGGGLALVEEGPLGGSVPMNLARQPGAVAFASDSVIGLPTFSIAGLNDGVYGYNNSWLGNTVSPAFAGIRFGGAYTISTVAFGRDNLSAYTDRTLGLYMLQYTMVANPNAATPFTGNAATGWATIGTLNYLGAGTGNFTSPSRRHRYTFNAVTATGVRLIVPAAGLVSGGTCLDELEVNPVDSASDVAFAAELVSSVVLDPGTPFAESPEAWIELYNRGVDVVDLSGWRLSGGIDFVFPQGTSLAPDSYLVLANDAAAFQAKYPDVPITGEFANHLSHHGELVVLRDARDNPANAVHYFDGGRWPENADGGGSSLELIDPRADNSSAEAWAASDESGKSSWTNVTWRGVATDDLGPTLWKEFALGLLDAGEMLLDDFSVIDLISGAELIQNGSFESGLNGWRLLGNHNGEVVLDPDQPGNHLLHLTATGVNDDFDNHIETTLANGASIVNGREYQISFRAKWVAGNNQLNTRLYHNRLARTTIIPAPNLNGTPGARNSRWQPNIGPTFSGLQHRPVAPEPNATVTVSLGAADPDGVSAMTLWWSANGGAWSSAPMSIDAQSVAMDQYAATIPGYGASTIVQFYVEATDGLGATTTFPAGGTNSRALYKINDGQADLALGHNFRLLMTGADTTTLLDLTNLMSNRLLPCTVLYDEQEVFYNVRVRLHGSANGRPSNNRVGFHVEFDPDHPFRGIHRTVEIDRSGGWRFTRTFGQDEILVRHILNRAGGVPTRYDDLARFIAPRTSLTSPCILALARYEDVFLDSQYENGGDGHVFEYDLIYFPVTTVDGGPLSPKYPSPYDHPPINPDLTNLGDDNESYRRHFLIKNHRARDDYHRVIELCRAFDQTGPGLESQLAPVLDTQEWLRTFAILSLCGIGDAYSQGQDHNLGLYVRPADNRVLALPWDWDFAFFNATNAPLWGDMNVGKFIALPSTQRSFYWHLRDIIGKVFNADYMSYWTDHYDNFLPSTGSYPTQNFSSILAWIGQRASFVQSQIPAPVPFAITSNGGDNFMTNQPSALIEGSASIDVKEISLAGNSAPLALNWISPTNWQACIPLILGANQFTFTAYDYQGTPAASASITITCTVSGGGADTDNDGLPDVWELANGLNPALNDASADNDGDGLTNLQEYLAGTDPNDRQSFLRIDGANGAGAVRLTFLAVAGRSYTLLQRDNANSGGWNKVIDVPAQATNQLVEVLVPQPLPVPQQFYRLATPQQP